MNLTVMTRNALRVCAENHGLWKPETDADWDTGPSKQVVAQLTYEQVKSTYGIGKLGLADVVSWLAEDGLTLRAMPAPFVRVQVTQAALDRAADFLRRHGYTVKEPGA